MPTCCGSSWNFHVIKLIIPESQIGLLQTSKRTRLPWGSPSGLRALMLSCKYGATNPKRNMLEEEGHIVNDHNYQVNQNKKHRGSSEFFNSLQNKMNFKLDIHQFLGKNLPTLICRHFPLLQLSECEPYMFVRLMTPENEND